MKVEFIEFALCEDLNNPRNQEYAQESSFLLYRSSVAQQLTPISFVSDQITQEIIGDDCTAPKKLTRVKIVGNGGEPISLGESQCHTFNELKTLIKDVSGKVLRFPQYYENPEEGKQLVELAVSEIAECVCILLEVRAEVAA